ncbi:undecaprenyl-phosphate glucose phosphotransferase [Vibrio bivalvicida]|uniref:Undecaprenyl-phosphate glucose phosphotransferase n=1 Tax=Vibrio bivalvicida TaxID=1276888 RepID=A0ABV4MME8_9VIBR
MDMTTHSKVKFGENESSALYRIVDGIVIVSFLLAVSTIYLGDFSKIYTISGLLSALLFVFFAEKSGLYRYNGVFVQRHEFKNIIGAWLQTLLVLLLFAFFTKWTEVHSRVVITTWMLATPLLIISSRLAGNQLIRSHYKKHQYKQKAIIVGVSNAGIRLAHDIANDKSSSLDFVGFYDDREPSRLAKDGLSKPILGTIKDSVEKAKKREVRHVYIALPMGEVKRVKDVVKMFSDTTARVYLIPDIYTYELMQARWRTIGNSPTISVQDTPFYGLASVVKRIEDVVLATLIALLISPVLLFVAIGVKLSGPGPIIFKQIRYGLDGAAIKVWKFRSMNTTDNGNVVKQATKNDPRVTRFGAFIRRTSLDELPQFINVIQGRMSIVGPRPHAVAHNEEYRQIVDKYMLRHKVKPGITGLAQISGYRGETDTLEKMEKRVEYDLKYIQNWSLSLDLRIIFLTIFKGFVAKTAY